MFIEIMGWNEMGLDKIISINYMSQLIGLDIDVNICPLNINMQLK